MEDPGVRPSTLYRIAINLSNNTKVLFGFYDFCYYVFLGSTEPTLPPPPSPPAPKLTLITTNDKTGIEMNIGKKIP